MAIQSTSLSSKVAGGTEKSDDSFTQARLHAGMAVAALPQARAGSWGGRQCVQGCGCWARRPRRMATPYVHSDRHVAWRRPRVGACLRHLWRTRASRRVVLTSFYKGVCMFNLHLERQCSVKPLGVLFYRQSSPRPTCHMALPWCRSWVTNERRTVRLNEERLHTWLVYRMSISHIDFGREIARDFLLRSPLE